MLSRILNIMRPKSTFDLIVCGSTLSTYIAVYSAHLNGLKVAWINPEIGNFPPFNKPEGVAFDSLAPEGVRYLNHLLGAEEIEKASRGVFRGVLRGNQYQVFDSMLGDGIQLDMMVLKRSLYKKIRSNVRLISDDAVSLTEAGNIVQVVTQFDKTYQCKWLINGQGKDSDISSQPIDYVSEDLWVSREITETEGVIKNTAKFEQDVDGWRWLAYDDRGRLCTTQWKKQPWNVTSTCAPMENAFNGQWYKRTNSVESLGGVVPRVLLTVPTCFRFDPSSGMGATLQIKSAMLAVRSVTLAGAEDASAVFHVKHYERQMEDTFSEISRGLVPFYKRYGLRFPAIQGYSMPGSRNESFEKV